MNEKKIPTQTESPNGLHQRYVVKKMVKNPAFKGSYTEQTISIPGYKDQMRKSPPEFIEAPTDKGAEYFVLRLDAGGKDPDHINACRAAVLVYADKIEVKLPELAADIRARYSEPVKSNLNSEYWEILKKNCPLTTEEFRVWLDERMRIPFWKAIFAGRTLEAMPYNYQIAVIREYLNQPLIGLYYLVTDEVIEYVAPCVFGKYLQDMFLSRESKLAAKKANNAEEEKGS